MKSAGIPLKRSLSIATLVVLFFQAGLRAAENAYDIGRYLSVVPGSAFTNQLKYNGTATKLLEAVIVSDELHGVPTIERQAYVNGNYDHSACWSFSAEGLRFHKSRAVNADMTQSVLVNDEPMLVAPPRWHDGMRHAVQQAYHGTNLNTGSSWTGTNYSTMTCVGPENVVVSGRSFETLKFQWILSTDDTRGNCVTNNGTLWHVLGVGQVKEHVEVNQLGKAPFQYDIEVVSFMIPTSVQPSLSNPRYLNGVGCSFDLNLQTNRIYRIQRSSDLMGWSDLAAFAKIHLETWLDYTDAHATNQAIRFYRVVSP
jgi:hypothetical protein